MMTGYTSLAVRVRPDFRVHALLPSSEEPAMRVDLPPGRLKNRVPTRESEESLSRKKVPPSRSATGFLLMDSSLKSHLVHAEAIQFLGYPTRWGNQSARRSSSPEKIRSTLLTGRPLGSVPFVTEFRSGRRTIFAGPSLWMRTANDPSHPCIAVLLNEAPPDSSLVASLSTI